MPNLFEASTSQHCKSTSSQDGDYGSSVTPQSIRVNNDHLFNRTLSMSQNIDITNIPSSSHANGQENPRVDGLEGYFDIGDPEYECSKCGALMWYAERLTGTKDHEDPEFSICCGDGKVQLPYLNNPPQLLIDLLTRRHPKSNNFIDNIRAYNTMFSFTSMGGKIHHSVNHGRGPYTFRMSGQNVHLIGGLLPQNHEPPKFCQLYIYDTEDEILNRKKVVGSNNQSRLDDELIELLKEMIDIHNPISASFRMAEDRIQSHNVDQEFKLRLIADRYTDGKTHNFPTASEVAALIVCDEGDDFEEHCGNFQRISELHAAYLPMQYPILFLYGEDGYRTGIKHSDAYLNVNSSENPHEEVTMREWLTFCIQDRRVEIESPTLLYFRRLFQQFLVDGCTMVESQRLSYIRNNQKKLRAEKYSNLSNVVSRGETDSSSSRNLIAVPSTFLGGMAMQEKVIKIP